jgi:hypothetical protein
MRCLRPAAAMLGGVLWLGVGCGLRSDALDEFDGGGIALTEGTEPGDLGSCEMPKGIPAELEVFTLSGQLTGTGSEQGPCGRDDGPEAVYSFSPTRTLDVTLRVIADQTSFSPTVRVERDRCGDPRAAAEICASDLLRPDGTEALARHFLAEAGSTYYVTVDSPARTSGSFGVELRAGAVPLAQCSVHAETITHAPGGTFSWLNDLTEGYGRVGSRCGAPGKENMFRVVVNQPGWIFAGATGTGGFIPVLSLRTSCSAATEIDCMSSGGANVGGEWFVEPGEYYLTVDNATTAAGGYQLFVDFG